MTDQATIKVAAFYQFTPQSDLPERQAALKAACTAAEARGIVLLAPEGVNGTIACVPGAMEGLLAAIRLIAGASDLDVKFSFAKEMPFKRMKVRLKKEIVTIGDTSVDPSTVVGTYVEPRNWNALIADPDVVVIDTRNAYEVAVGTFEGALDPATDSFGAFPEWVKRNLDPAKHKKVAMFCTGGIRCEKASSFMRREGFEEVFHLKGGILKYLEEVPAEESRWRGGCFVFDERVAVGHGLEPMPVRMCRSCDTPLTADLLSGEGYEEGVSCPHCVERLSEAQKASARERQRQFVLRGEG